MWDQKWSAEIEALTLHVAVFLTSPQTHQVSVDHHTVHHDDDEDDDDDDDYDDYDDDDDDDDDDALLSWSGKRESQFGLLPFLPRTPAPLSKMLFLFVKNTW